MKKLLASLALGLSLLTSSVSALAQTPAPAAPAAAPASAKTLGATPVARVNAVERPIG